MIGLSTYAYLWHWSKANPTPWDLVDMMRDAAHLGASVFQICDYPPLLRLDERACRNARALAEEHGLTLELGTRGVSPQHLRRYLDLACALGSDLVRTMISRDPGEPELDEVPNLLTDVLADYRDRGVRLALETYEKVPTASLVDVVKRVGHPSLGIVLDPGNCVAALEHPLDVVEQTTPYVLNIHVKDFAFTRREDWVGFTFAGAPLGTGLLDYDHMVERLRPIERGISQVVEHWLPWASDLETTLRTEREWTQHALDYLRRKNA